MKAKNGLIVIIDWDKQKNYDGFDGKEVWPGIEDSITLSNGFAPIEELEEVLKYKENIKEARLLYLQPSNSIEVLPETVLSKFSFVGYDYGNYISEYNYYSLIYQEVICGQRKEFKTYTAYLNKSLLFSSLEQISSLEKVQIELVVEGEDLEEEIMSEKFQPIAIYSYSEKH